MITQNANVNVPVLAIGGSNGLAPEPKSFQRYLDSIATPAADKRVLILEGYAHLDVISARNNGAVAAGRRLRERDAAAQAARALLGAASRVISSNFARLGLAARARFAVACGFRGGTGT